MSPLDTMVREPVAGAVAHPVPTDSYRLARAFLVLMSLVTIDVFNFLDRGRTAISQGANERPGPLPATFTGEGLELLPLTSPTDLSVGDSSRFRVLLDGKPYAGAEVTLIRGGNRYRYRMGEIALKADAAGEFSVAWPEAGRYWLGVNHGGRPQGGPGAASAGLVRRATYAATFEVLPR